jgi:uncharacterized protein (DUF362 family)
VGAVYDEFVRELSELRLKYSGQPRREMILLCLLSLEREEIVSVAYREETFLRRLAAMPIPAEVRDLIHHALVWAWKDEEMHAIYIRGVLLKLGGPLLRAQTFLRQFAGAVGGWSSSLRQHVRWSEAPFSRALATLITWGGVATGKVPRDVKQHLDYGSFRDFSLFNIDAEKTAWLCWRRLAELALSQPDISAQMHTDFQRVQDDEARHEKIFAIIAEALDQQNRLVPGVTAETLAEKIGAVGEVFLPRSRRKLATHNPLGSGTPVWVASGSTASEKLALFRGLLDDSGLTLALESQAQTQHKDLSDLQVVIKVTFMLGYDHRDTSGITDPELVEALAEYLAALGCRNIAVVEGRNVYDSFYRNRTVKDVAHYFGYESPHYRIVDTTEEQIFHEYFRGMAVYGIGRTWKEADFRITFGKLRSHPSHIAYLALGNVEGVGARCHDFIFTERQAHRLTSIMMLLDEFPPHFALLDAYDSAADGLIGVMGCSKPRTPRRLYASADALAVDTVVLRHIGVENPRDSDIVDAACHWFGSTTGQPEVRGLDKAVAWHGPYDDELSAFLSLMSFPVYVLASRRGALFVPAMDKSAFPALGREGLVVRICRRTAQLVLGLHPPK